MNMKLSNKARWQVGFYSVLCALWVILAVFLCWAGFEFVREYNHYPSAIPLWCGSAVLLGATYTTIAKIKKIIRLR